MAMMNHLVTIMATLIQITVLVREEVPKLSSRVGCYTILIVYSMVDVVWYSSEIPQRLVTRFSAK